MVYNEDAYREIFPEPIPEPVKPIKETMIPDIEPEETNETETLEVDPPESDTEGGENNDTGGDDTTD